ncbi:MAG: MFS transporter [Pseudomonadota bacterium]
MSDEPNYPAERFGWYVVFVLCVCGVVANIDRQIINLLVEDIRADLVVSDTQISLLQGFAFAMFYAIVAIPLGRLADSKNRRNLIAIGIVAWTLAAIACGLAETYAQLFAARMAVGIGEAVLTPAGFSLLADMFKPRRLARPLSVYTASSFLGGGIALMVGGIIIRALDNPVDDSMLAFLGDREPWQSAFILGALPGLPVALWFFLSVKEPPRRATAKARTDAEQYRQGFSHAIRFCLDNGRLFLAVFVGISMMAAAQFALGAWVPAYFIRVHEWTAAEIGAAQGLLFMIGGTAGVVAGGWVTDFLFKRGYHDANLRTAAIAALGCIPFALAAMLVTDGTLAIWLLAPAMFFGTMPFGPGPATIPIIAPPYFRAQLVALYLLVANLVGQSGGPWVVAMLTDNLFKRPDAINYSLAITVPVLLLIGAGLATVGWKPLRERLAEDQQ